MARDVFISYSHVDAAIANEACAKLEGSGIPCWIAPRDAVAGERYPAQIVDAIASAKLLLLILSTHANDSAQVQSEVERAFSKGIAILPMRIENFTPTGDLEYLVAGTHWLDAVTPPVEGYFDNLVDAVRRLTSVAHRHSSPSLDGAQSAPAFATPTNNIPTPLTALVGREEDCSKVVALMHGSRLVTINGAGGVGKTRCALEVAQRLLYEFEDGAWFLDLSSINDGTFVPDVVLTTIGIQRSATRPAIDSINAFLQRRHVLLVLDNCEHVVGETASATANILRACSRVAILATSREPLGIGGEAVYRLSTLQVPDDVAAATAATGLQYGSVRLFVDRVVSNDPGYALTDPDARMVASICRRLDGLPLALELAAARVHVLGLRRVAEGLDERFRLLSAGDRTAPARLQTLKALVDWSYDALAPTEQALFRRLAVFLGGFTLDAATVITHSEVSDDVAIIDLLTSLVDKSLIISDAAPDDPSLARRYRYLETLREYALEKQLAFVERDATMRAFTAWSISLARQADETWAHLTSDEWDTRFTPEMVNLRSALVWSLQERNATDLGVELVAVARRLWARLAPAEGLKWIELGRAETNDRTPSSTVAALWLAEAQNCVALWRFHAALESASKAVDAYRALHDDLPQLEAQGFLGYSLCILGRPEEGLPILENVLTSYRVRGERQLLAYALIDSAVAHTIARKFDSAEQLFAESRTLYEELGNDRGVMTASGGLAELKFQSGQPEAAIPFIEDALRRRPEGRESAGLLANMAAYLIALDRWDAAREKARESLAKAGTAIGQVNTAWAIQHLAAIAALRPSALDADGLGDRERAARLLGFLDAEFPTSEVPREYTEQQEYDRVLEQLRADLGDKRLADSLREGRAYDLARALSEARAI